MAYFFGDGFDLYATTADTINGYWDSGSGSPASIIAGRFTGSRAWATTATANNASLVKSSGVNDAVHHICLAFNTPTFTGANLVTALTLSDVATAQCTINFRSDGAILLTSGTAVGATLATYTGAFTASNTWYQFEFEVIINNTTGRFRARKNGNPVDDFDSGATLNTRPVSTNNYANKLTFGTGPNGNLASHTIDDLLWRSDASSVPWAGDVRCYTRMPGSDVAVQWSRTPTGVLTQTVPTSAPGSLVTTFDSYTAFTAGYSGVVTSVGVVISTIGNATGMKCAIYADNGSANGPGVVLASATAIITPALGTNSFTFSPGVTVTQGTRYWVGSSCNGATAFYPATNSNVTTGAFGSAGYATFPVANPVVTYPGNAGQKSWTYTATPANWQAISEAQQDAGASYISSANVGDTDLYGLQPITGTPATIIATTLRGMLQKSDAGSRAVALNLKSGSTLSTGSNLVLSTSGFGWGYRTDLVDPNTGAAWTATAVNNLQVGCSVTV